MATSPVPVLSYRVSMIEGGPTEASDLGLRLAWLASLNYKPATFTSGRQVRT